MSANDLDSSQFSANNSGSSQFKFCILSANDSMIHIIQYEFQGTLRYVISN